MLFAVCCACVLGGGGSCRLVRDDYWKGRYGHGMGVLRLW